MDRSTWCGPILGVRRPLGVAIYVGSLPVSLCNGRGALTSFYVFIPDSQPLLNGDSDNDTVDCHGDTHVTLARL